MLKIVTHVWSDVDHCVPYVNVYNIRSAYDTPTAFMNIDFISGLYAYLLRLIKYTHALNCKCLLAGTYSARQ